MHSQDDWLKEETISDIAKTFQALTEHPYADALEEMKVLRQCWNKEAMQLAVKRLPTATKAKLRQIVLDIDNLERLEQLKNVAEEIIKSRENDE